MEESKLWKANWIWSKGYPWTSNPGHMNWCIFAVNLTFLIQMEQNSLLISRRIAGTDYFLTVNPSLLDPAKVTSSAIITKQLI